ncbi:tropomodulin-4-like [Hippocampus comes]|uniref:tropomodulin-4-like n=1 Tax=Hippocampus comes TaxID=109280 RepID=UPI00094F1335|nr:PREDICTED: tropomodulin-4-like [Hippocampus comes]
MAIACHSQIKAQHDPANVFSPPAAILGMYTLMSNKQYYDALGTTGTIANTEGINSVVKEDPFKIFPDEPPNPTNVEETLERIQNNDSSLTAVNFNNIKVKPDVHRTSNRSVESIRQPMKCLLGGFSKFWSP